MRDGEGAVVYNRMEIFFRKGQRVNTLDFVTHLDSVTTTQLGL